MSISAFSRNTVEIVQISTLLEKQKRFMSICYLSIYSSIVSYILLVFSLKFRLIQAAKIGKIREGWGSIVAISKSQ